MMHQLPWKFENHTGKFLDIEHLGYKTPTQLVYQYGFLVLVDKATTEFSRIVPTYVIREIVAEVAVVISKHDPHRLKPT